jgi:chemotaxis family two-component system sensor kinase Cph1
VRVNSPTDAPNPDLPDLDQCADEPIERPGSVQPHGVLLVVQESSWTLLSASDNAARLLPGGRFEPGAALTAVLGESLTGEVRERVADEDFSEPIRWDGPAAGPWAGHPVDVLLHRSASRLIVEFEAIDDDPRARLVSVSATRAAIDRLGRGRTSVEVLDQLARAVRKVTGFDRVMVYRFDREWHGEVIAEDRLPILEPLLGLRYPQSDIPAQARRLYTLSRLRFIVDSHAVASRMLPPVPDDGGGELDMSYAPLRSVSPVHLEYLVGMGVRASMSVSMLRNGQLWGLVACHHYAGPLQPSHDQRAAADLLTQAAVQLVTERQAAQDAVRLADGRERLGRLTRLVEQTDDAPVQALAGGDLRELAELADATGLVLRSGAEWTRWGRSVDDDAVEQIIRALRRVDGVPTFSDHLESLRPGLGTDAAAGALLLQLAPRQWILWLGEASERTIRWAGDPDDKTVTIRADGSARIGPRRSFAAEQEIVRGRSRQEREALAVAEDLHDALLPDRLPSVPGVELEVRYLPAPGGRFGGDWWDAFPLPDRKLALVVGDVAGHGAGAAGTMSQLRTALRAYLMEGRPPGETLARLDGLAHLLFPAKLATVILAVLDLKSGELQVARAGHPHPILAAGGRARAVEVEGRPPIGLGLESGADTWTGILDEGDILVLHSDGLNERREITLAEGSALVAAAVPTAPGEPLSQIADGLITAVPGETQDDRTVLIARWIGR